MNYFPNNTINQPSSKSLGILEWFLIIVFIGILILIFLLWWFLLRMPKCGADINPNKFYCTKNGKKVRNKLIPKKRCEISTSSTTKIKNLAIFLQYMERLQFQQQKIRNNDTSPSLLQIGNTTTMNRDDDVKIDIYQGIFYFAIPPLLQLLPTDFGQNKSTPYGIMSFFNLYPNCIPDKTAFCEKTVASKNVLVKLCKAYLKQKANNVTGSSSSSSCLFPLQSTNTDLYIRDDVFFNQLGMLGSLSITMSDVFIIYVNLPVNELCLNYWSFEIYLSDHFKSGDECYPFRQVNASLLCPSLNNINILSNPSFQESCQGEQNPFLLEYIHLFIIITLNQDLDKQINKQINDLFYNLPNRVVHTFGIPSATGSLPHDPSLPNPNRYTYESAYFHEQYDRFAVFLRLSQFPNANQEEKNRLQQFIYQKEKYNQNLETIMCRFHDISTTSSSSSSLRFNYGIFPKIIPPPFDEISNLEAEFVNCKKRIRELFFSFSPKKKKIFYHSLQTRNCLANIFAPGYRNIVYDPSITYKGGFQAFQVAGNGQADNYDAQYRTSETVCLNSHDIFFSFCVNHSHFKNCIYNSLNIIDFNKAYSIYSAELDFQSPYKYYLVLSSRNSVLLQNLIQHISPSCQELNISLFSYVITTNPMDPMDPMDDDTKQQQNQDDVVSSCHQLLAVERMYINPILSPFSTLFSIFGNDLSKSVSNLHDFSIFKNACAPSLVTLIPPFYAKVSIYDKTDYYILILLFFIFLFVFVILLFIRFSSI